MPKKSFLRSVLFRSEAGASLPIVMVIAAAISGLMVTTMSIDKERKKTIETDEINFKIDDLTNLIMLTLSHPPSCKVNFQGRTDGDAALNNKITTANGIDIIPFGTLPVHLKKKYDGVLLSNAYLNISDSTVVLVFERLGAGAGGTIFGGKSIQKEIPMRFSSNMGQVVECFSDDLTIVQNFCEQHLQGTFTNGQCRDLDLLGDLNILDLDTFKGTLRGQQSATFVNTYGSTAEVRKSSPYVSVNASGIVQSASINLPNHGSSAANLYILNTVTPVTNITSNGLLRIRGTNRVRSTGAVSDTGSWPCYQVNDNGSFTCGDIFPW